VQALFTTMQSINGNVDVTGIHINIMNAVVNE
jgi:hypothetical protein